MASGKGANGGPAKQMLMFSVQFKINGKAVSGAKENVQVYVDSPSSQALRVNVMGGPNGLYHFGFTPDEPGV